MTLFREQMANMKQAVVKSLIVALLAVGISPVARADYAQEVMKDRPVAWWRFQDYSSAGGAVAKDETGRHAGVYLGHTTFEAGVPGIGGKAAKFDGKTACVQVAPHQDLAISELSVEVWIKSKQPWRAKQWPGSATLITKATSGPGSGDWTLNAGALQNGENEGRILLSTGSAGSGEDLNLNSGQGLNDGQWHHVVWTRSADGCNCLYLDGRLADQAEDDGGSIANDRPIQIGSDPHQGGSFLEDALAEAAIASLNWVLSQQNPDGGFPQVMEIQCLDRLFKQTGNPLFDRLKNRVIQLNFFVQVADLMLQLMEMGLVKKP